jgi:hypothetical protein
MSGVFQNIDPHPLTARRLCIYPPPPSLWCGGDTLAGLKGGWVVNILEDAMTLLCILHTVLCAFKPQRKEEWEW